METVKTLTCKFKDSEGRLRSISIDDPLEDLEPQVLNDFMNSAITSNILELDDSDDSVSLTSIVGAELTVRTTSDIDLTVE